MNGYAGTCGAPTFPFVASGSCRWTTASRQIRSAALDHLDPCRPGQRFGLSATFTGDHPFLPFTTQREEAPMPRNCEWCGMFMTADERQGRPRRFCTDRCRQRYAANDGIHPEQRTCSECSTRLPRGSRPDKTTCSVACRSVRHRRLKREAKETGQ